MKKRFLLLFATVLLLLTGCSPKGNEAWLRRMGKDSGYQNAFSQLSTISQRELEGASFLRFQQNYKGIPVWNRHVICLTDEKGEVLTVTGNPLDVDESLSLKPTVDAEQLRLAAQSYLGDTEFEAPGKDDLFIYNLGEDGKSHLAYHISAPACDLLIDAHTGELLNSFSLLRPEDEVLLTLQGQGDRSYDNVLCVQEGNWFYLRNPEKNIQVYHMITQSEEDWKKQPAGEIEPIRWNINGLFQDTYTRRAGVDAYVNTQIAYDYFSAAHKHTSPDREQNTTIKLYTEAEYVLPEGGLDNCFDNSIVHFEPDNNLVAVYFGELPDGTNISRILDVAAHEYTHSIEFMITRLNYCGESGAISEGLADIFGELIEQWYTKTVPDWIHRGRILKDPTTTGYPATYQGTHWKDPSASKDKGHVHNNSTVISHAAYRMSVDGGGLLSYDQLGDLMYRTMHLMPPDCDFTHFRTCTEWAAITMDLTQEQLQCISKAFDTVKIPTSSLRLAPGGRMHILDRADEPYSDYTYGIYRLDLDAMLDRDISKLDPVISGAQSGSDVLSPDLEVGYYYVVLLDNLDRSRSEAFDLTVWPGCPTEYDLHTNFGPFRIKGTVTDGDQPLSGVTVAVEGVDTPSVSTDENGEFTLNHDPSIRDLRLVFRKEGYQEETLSITLTPLDLVAGVHEIAPVVLKPEVHPYAQVIRDYETTYGTIGCHDWGYGNYTLTGVIYLNLLDFDADGTQELVMGYCDGGSDYTNYRLTVWTLQDDAAVLLYDRPCTHGSDISRWFELVQVDGVWHVGTGYTGYEDDLRYYALQNGEFEQVMHLTRDIIDEYYYFSESRFNGIIITIPEYGAHYKTWHTSAEKIDCVLSASDPEAELNALRQQSRDIYRQLGMED